MEGQYTKTANKKRSRMALLICLAALLAFAAVLVGAGRANAARQQAALAQERRQAAAAAAQRLETTRALVRELSAEADNLSCVKAADLAKTYHEEWVERTSTATSTGSKPTYTVPATGVFNAGAYGNDGSGNMGYWQGINSDVMGWLKVPGTNIDFPIVQYGDVNYYTHLDYNKQYSKNGVIWTNPGTRSGSTADSLSPNTVIYGHNWTNYSGAPRVGYSGDVMFAQLTGYHWLYTAQTYPYFYYTTAAGGHFTVKIFACFYTELAFNYIASDGDMNYIISEAQRRSRHTFDVDVNSSDKIVTLSTCTRAYGATSNQRFVVMGRLLRPGEAVGPVNITSNYSHKQPSVW